MSGTRITQTNRPMLANLTNNTRPARTSVTPPQGTTSYVSASPVPIEPMGTYVDDAGFTL